MPMFGPCKCRCEGGVGPTCIVCEALESGLAGLHIGYINVAASSWSGVFALLEPCLWTATHSCTDITFDARVSPPVLVVKNHVGDGCSPSAFEGRSDGDVPALIYSEAASTCDVERRVFVRTYTTSGSNPVLLSRGFTKFTINN